MNKVLFPTKSNNMSVVYLSSHSTRQLLDAKRLEEDRILIGLVNKNSDDLTFHVLTTIRKTLLREDDASLLDVVVPCGLSSIGTFSSKSCNNTLWIHQSDDGTQLIAIYQGDTLIPVKMNSPLDSMYRFRCVLSLDFLLSNRVSSLSSLISRGDFAVSSSSSSSEWLWLGSKPSTGKRLEDWLNESAGRLKTTKQQVIKKKKKSKKKKTTVRVSRLETSDFVTESSISNLYLLLDDENDDKVCPTFYFDGTRVSNRSVRFNLSVLIYANPDELATVFVDKVRHALCLQLEVQHALVLKKSSKEVTSHHFTPPVRRISLSVLHSFTHTHILNRFLLHLRTSHHLFILFLSQYHLPLLRMLIPQNNKNFVKGFMICLRFQRSHRT